MDLRPRKMKQKIQKWIKSKVVKMNISELWMVAIYIRGWLRFYFSALRAFYGIYDHFVVDDLVFHLN